MFIFSSLFSQVLILITPFQGFELSSWFSFRGLHPRLTYTALSGLASLFRPGTFLMICLLFIMQVSPSKNSSSFTIVWGKAGTAVFVIF
jgi:hypothetical protein